MVIHYQMRCEESELELTAEEADVIYFNVLCQNFLKQVRKSMKSINQGSQ